MTLAAWVLFAVLICFTGTILLIGLWARRTGQFDNVEHIAQRILEEDQHRE